MGKHAIASQKWAFSAEQTKNLLDNPEHLRYRQGQLDSLLAVSRLQQGLISVELFQELLDGLHKTWDAEISDAYVLGFEDMYSTLCEHLSTRYDPQPLEGSVDANAAVSTPLSEALNRLKPNKKTLRWDNWLDGK
jgi:hypothetical protein